MCLPFMRKLKILHFCLLVLWLQKSVALQLKPGKHSTIHVKDYKASRHNHDNKYRDSSQASRRSTYRINMPMKVAKLLLPQISNKNQETIIRIYPDKSADTQNQTGKNYMLDLSYKKLNDNGHGPTSTLTKFCDPNGGCCCCPGTNIDPMSICSPGCPICPTPCVCCCCSSPPPPPPPPPPKKPPPAPCPMVCLPLCCPCHRPPCPCRPSCIRRPVLRPCHPPCRIPAPPITGPIHGPCVAPPQVMGPCHPPCFPQPLPQPQRFPLIPLQAAPPILQTNKPIVVDHPLKGPPIFINQCHDVVPECRQYAKRGMCNHPSPFHNIQQIRKICPFSCGICNGYDENAALLRRHARMHSKPHDVSTDVRANLNRALQQIIRNKVLEGQTTMEPQEEKPDSKEAQTGQKKSHEAIALQTQSSQMLNGGEEEEFSASGGSEKSNRDSIK